MTICIILGVQALNSLNLLFPTAGIGRQVNDADPSLHKSRLGDRVVAGDQVVTAHVVSLPQLIKGPGGSKVTCPKQSRFRALNAENPCPARD